MDRRGNGRLAGLLGFDPIEAIVGYLAWKLRWAGRQVITGVVLIVGLGVMSAAFFIPLVLSHLIISIFELTVEPNKWLGSVLIVGSFAFGFVAAPLMLRRVIRRGRAVIALTEFGDDDHRGAPAGPSPFFSPRASREQWTAGIRALDDRIGTAPSEPSATVSAGEDSAGDGESPSRP